MLESATTEDYIEEVKRSKKTKHFFYLIKSNRSCLQMHIRVTSNNRDLVDSAL